MVQRPHRLIATLLVVPLLCAALAGCGAIESIVDDVRQSTTSDDDESRTEDDEPRNEDDEPARG